MAGEFLECFWGYEEGFDFICMFCFLGTWRGVFCWAFKRYEDSENLARDKRDALLCTYE